VAEGSRPGGGERPRDGGASGGAPYLPPQTVERIADRSDEHRCKKLLGLTPEAEV